MQELIKQLRFIAVSMLNYALPSSLHQNIQNNIVYLFHRSTPSICNLNNKPEIETILNAHQLLALELSQLPDSDLKTTLSTLNQTADDLLRLAIKLQFNEIKLDTTTYLLLSHQLQILQLALLQRGNITLNVLSNFTLYKGFHDEYLQLTSIKQQKDEKLKTTVQNTKHEPFLPKLNPTPTPHLNQTAEKKSVTQQKLPPVIPVQKPVITATKAETKKPAFNPVKPIVVVSEVKKKHAAEFHHSVHRTRKKPKGKVKRDNHIWYWKKNKSHAILDACCELICQELLRFFTGTHPKTRFGTNDNNELGIMSKEIEEFRQLTGLSLAALQSAIESGRVTGLFENLLISMFLAEDDVKSDNLGIDKFGRIIKIDGDSTLANYTYPSPNSNYNFTANDLENPLKPSTYRVWNWFCHYANGRHVSSLFNPQINSRIRHEINKAMLKIMLMPPEFYSSFVNCYSINHIRVNIQSRLTKATRQESAANIIKQLLENRRRLFLNVAMKTGFF